MVQLREIIYNLYKENKLSDKITIMYRTKINNQDEFIGYQYYDKINDLLVTEEGETYSLDSDVEEFYDYYLDEELLIVYI